MLLLEDKLRKIKDTLNITGDFGCNSYDECDFGYAIDWLWNNLNGIAKNEIINISRGVSKAAIILDSCSYVLKVPFNGEYFYEVNEEGYETDDEGFDYFCGAPNSENNWDYCKLETEYYQKAVDAGVECFFARTKEYGETPNGYPVYIQEKVIPNSEMSNEKKEEFSSTLYDYIQKNRYLLDCVYDVNWVAAAISHYGFNKFCDLLKFYHSNYEMFDDLHDGNYGYRENGEPVLLDFCGWNN